ncbi:armadillo repeat protein deleted in velo-cardio-facial syndrome isoform x2 [Limosa lapponica baueri]|uniref:Armadillo repeat protein deleted in velo-cardio-facial syndrome isoform x2 n=1 Tax=Limosa lapponica baueri TaxID=1758121 RepID=A0A2I0U4U6_LIMLA|nr:armadillo repeat protein deleted in velo-cardio-facial syndrome isoform x2 [Limosa lapponica baueri]
MQRVLPHLLKKDRYGDRFEWKLECKVNLQPSLDMQSFELLYQPDVVRLYLSILTESQNFNTLEAAAGALQNLSAGNWMVSAVVFLVSFVSFVEVKTKAVARYRCAVTLYVYISCKKEGGSYAMGELVRNLPSRQQRSAKNLEEDTVVAVLNTIHEIITDSSENARSLIQTQGIQKLVAISKSSLCIQYFLDLSDNEKSGSRDMIPMDELGPDGYSTIDHRDKERKYKTSDNTGDASEKEPLKVSVLLLLNAPQCP